MARYKHTAMLLMLGWGVAACSGQDEAAERAKAEEEQQLLAAKEKAVQTYLGAGKVIGPKLEAFRDVLLEVQSACRENCDIPSHKKAFEEKVLPSYDAVLRALDTMPTETDQLGAIHAKLLDAYRKSGQMLVDYPKGLDVQNKDARLVAYIQDLSVSIRDVEEAYKKELREYCSEAPKVDCTLSSKK